MKDIRQRLIELFKKGFCTPQIARIAKKLKEPSTTLHYNIKRLEQEKAILTYKAVFDYKKIDQGFCAYIMVNLSHEEYGKPEDTAKEIAKDSRVESIDICTGDFEILLKLRTKDIDEYYEFIKYITQKHKLSKVVSITSLKQIKTEFVDLD